jgi:hypothetical protein
LLAFQQTMNHNMVVYTYSFSIRISTTGGLTCTLRVGLYLTTSSNRISSERL